MDFGNGRLKKFYYSESRADLNNCPIPRRDLLHKEQYDTINLVQTSRGCTYKCHFCSVASLYGTGIRVRPVDNVLAEIKTLTGNDILFVDDNLLGKKSYVKELLSRLVPLKKKWIGQADVTVAYRKEILKLLEKSGCAGLFVGFETISHANLSAVGKTQNCGSDYIEAIKRLHDHGMAILGSFIVGFDTDDKFCFENLLEFVVKSKIDVVDVTVMTPYPGTVLYKRMKAESRLVDVHWWHAYDPSDVVFKPRRMTRTELYEGRVWLLRQLHRMDRLMKRWLEGLGRRSLFGNYISLKANFGYRKKANAIPRKAIDLYKDNEELMLGRGIQIPSS